MKNGKIEESDIENILLSIGIPANLLGFVYITDAIQVLNEHPEYLRKIMNLYVDVAEKHGRKPLSVERCIRHAIGVGWLYGNLDFIEYLFKNSVNPMRGTPTNSQFVSRLYYYFLHNNIAA